MLNPAYMENVDMPHTRVVGFSAPTPSPRALQRSPSYAISPLSQMLSNLRSEEERFLRSNSRDDGFISADSDDTDVGESRTLPSDELLDSAATSDVGGRKGADSVIGERFECMDDNLSPKFVPAAPIDIPYNNDGYRHWRRQPQRRRVNWVTEQ